MGSGSCDFWHGGRIAMRPAPFFFLCATIGLACCGTSCRVRTITNLASPARIAHPVEVTTPGNIAMVALPGGTFVMGNSNGAADESPTHEVILAPFAIDKYEATQDQFAALQIPDPSHFKDPRRPVEQVRWSDAALFCNLRSIDDGLEPCYNEATFECNFEASGYRLPTEAEWEFAARAGKEALSGGGTPAPIGQYACYSGNSRKKTGLVGRKRPNAWGLHDMQGNVLEWCHDIYGDDYYEISPTSNPRGAFDGERRVLRGGSWNAGDSACGLTTRAADVPGITDACFARDTYGFRCVRMLTAEENDEIRRANEGAKRQQ
jgi:formylglycine-generating enzyme required for sulfatase activity